MKNNHAEKLKQLGVYKQFLYNLRRNDTTISQHNKRSEFFTFSNYVLSAFVFCDTPEGYEFWSNISNK